MKTTTVRPRTPAWNDAESFTIVAALALFLSGLTYDHSSFEIRTGGVWLAGAALVKASSVVRYRRRRSGRHATPEDETPRDQPGAL